MFCNSVPEPDIWRKYIEELEEAASGHLRAVQFRSKEHGGSWRKGMFVAEFMHGHEAIIEPLAGNVYADAFFMRLSKRASCLRCCFKNGKCSADLMIGDFWGIEESHPELDDGKGVNAVIVYTKTGEKFFSETKCWRQIVSYADIVARNRYLEHSVTCDVELRRRFLSYCKIMTLKEAIEKVSHRPLWKRLLSVVGRIVCKARGRHGR